jgi:uncharacterized membrane protein
MDVAGGASLLFVTNAVAIAFTATLVSSHLDLAQNRLRSQTVCRAA